MMQTEYAVLPLGIDTNKEHLHYKVTSTAHSALAQGYSC